jgi:hypothetical protein
MGFKTRIYARYQIIEAAVSVAHVEDATRKILAKFFHEYNLPMPRIKIVNQITSPWLGRCSYRPSIDKNNTTIEIQKRATNDEKSLDRILAHELIHHYDFITRYGHPQTGNETWEKDRQRTRLGFKSDGHGKEFKEWAAKINAVMGADYVTEKSDMSYVTELDKEYFLLIVPSKDKSKFSFAWMVKPSKDQQAAAQRLMQDRDAKLFMSKDERFIVPKFRVKKYGSTGIPQDPERQEFLKTLYHSGKAITPNWTKLITKLSDFAAPASKGMDHILTKDPLGVLGD